MSARGEITTEPVPFNKYRVPGLEGYTIIPRWKIVVTEKGEQAKVQTPYAGHFVGEEYHGGEHPLLLIPPDRVEK